LTYHRYRVLLLALFCPLIGSASAGAATTSALKTSTPITQSGMQAINASIAVDVAKLTAANQSQNPTAFSQARKALIDDADLPATASPPATQAYQSAYATGIIAAMTPLLSNPDFKLKLNAAIILGGVAEKVSRTNSAAVFEPVAKTMMRDKAWQVALWGVKVARYAMADGLLNKNGTKLAGDIVNTVQANEKSDAIVEEAYLALVLNQLRADPAYGQCLQQTLNPMLGLIEWRTTLYQNGSVPVAPGAEANPANTLPIDGFAMLSQPANKKLKAHTLKALGDLTVAQLTAISAGNGDAGLVDSAERLGSAMNGFGQKLPDTALAAAGVQITKLGANPLPATVNSCIAALNAALTSFLASAQ
jgi:hypothetical protein